MRGFQTLPCAQVVCAGHAFMRNLRNGFYNMNSAGHEARRPQALRLVRAWNELMLILSVA